MNINDTNKYEEVTPGDVFMDWDAEAAYEADHDLLRPGNVSPIDLVKVKWVRHKIATTGLIADIAQWRAEDIEIEKTFGKRAGGRPPTVVLTDEHIMIAMMILAQESSPLWIKSIRDLFHFRLTQDARKFLDIDHLTAKGNLFAQEKTWYSRCERALHKLIDTMDAYPAYRVVMNRAERDHTFSLRELNRERWNLDAKRIRKDKFSFAMINMTMKMIEPSQLALWEGSVSIDQTTVRAASKRGFTKGESKDPTLDSTVLEIDAGWAIKDPAKRNKDGNDHKAEATWGYKANFAVMCAEDPFEPSPHPRLIAGMTISTPNRGVGLEAVELLRHLVEAGYSPGRVTTDKEYAANMKPENYHFPLLALGYRIVTDYQKDELGQRGTQRGALIIDGTFKCPGLPKKLKELNEKFVNQNEAEYKERHDVTKKRSPEEKRAALEKHDELLIESAKYDFQVHTARTEHGAIKLTCPARGKSATVTCPLYVPTVKQTEKERTDVLNPPVRPDECCTHDVITMHPVEEWRYLQSLPYQSPEWRRTYSVDRNIVEGANAHIKDEGKEALHNSGRRRMRGLTAQQFAITFLVVAANIRKINEWRRIEEMTDSQKPKPPKPRKREHLSLHNFDPRIPEVRERAGLAPLENSHRRDSKQKIRELALGRDAPIF